MDFVVVGLGLGALGILLGVIAQVWLAPRWERAAARATSPDEIAFDLAVAADRRVVSQALLSAGGAILLATIGALAGSLDDRTGAFLVATTATVGAIGILVWGYRHRSRHPLPRRPRRRNEPRAHATGVVLEPTMPAGQPALAVDAARPLLGVQSPEAPVATASDRLQTLTAEEWNPNADGDLLAVEAAPLEPAPQSLEPHATDETGIVAPVEPSAPALDAESGNEAERGQPEAVAFVAPAAAERQSPRADQDE